MVKKNVMIRGLVLFFMICLLSVQSVVAVRTDVKEDDDGKKNILSKYMTTLVSVKDSVLHVDTVSVIYKKYISDIEEILSSERMYVKNNPAHYRLFTPLAFYYSPFESISRLDEEDKHLTLKEHPYNDYSRFFEMNDYFGINRSEMVKKMIDRMLLYMYVRNPHLLVTTEDRIMNRVVLKETVEEEINKKPKLIDLFTPEKSLASVEKVDFRLKRPNWWVTGGNFSLHLTQNSVSENWHKGGENNYSGLFQMFLFANYDNKRNVLFENKLEVKIGLHSTPSDKAHKYLINTDLSRFTTKLGVKAFDKWYYSFSADFKTQLFDGYRANNDKKVSSLLSPADLSVSVGMDYKLRTKKLNLSVFISPLTYTMRYVHDQDLDVTRFGVDKDKRAKNSFGSKLKPVLNWDILKYIKFESKLEFLTNYHWARVEWENKIDFVLNRYLSTQLFVHARFDDSSKRVKDESFFQYKQMLSFGINYRW